MLSFRLPYRRKPYGKYGGSLCLEGEKKQGCHTCQIFAFPYIPATFDVCPFLAKKETLWEIDLYNSVIQVVENAFHLAWKE